MSIPITLQIPIRTKGGSAWLFRRDIKVPILFTGMGLSGWGIPRFLDAGTDVCTLIAEVTVHESGKVFATAYGTEAMEHSNEQVLRQLGPGWRVVDIEIPPSETGLDDACDDPSDPHDPHDPSLN